MTFSIPSDTHAAGDTGHISDHNNIADVLAALAGLSTYGEPSGATARTMPRWAASSPTSTLITQTLYVTAIPMFGNTVVNNITFSTKSTGTGGATVTHGWYVLLDDDLVVRAVTADQNGSTSFLASANTPYPLAVASAYTATYSGLYYAGIMVECGTMPNLASNGAIASGLADAAPVLCGTSSTGETTPPSTGTTMGSLTGAGGFFAYAYTS